MWTVVDSVDSLYVSTSHFLPPICDHLYLHFSVNIYNYIHIYNYIYNIIIYKYIINNIIKYKY